MKQAKTSTEILDEIATCQKQAPELLKQGDGKGLLALSERVQVLCTDLGKAYMREARDKSNSQKLADMMEQLPDHKQARQALENLQRFQQPLPFKKDPNA